MRFSTRNARWMAGAALPLIALAGNAQQKDSAAKPEPAFAHADFIGEIPDKPYKDDPAVDDYQNQLGRAPAGPSRSGGGPEPRPPSAAPIPPLDGAGNMRAAPGGVPFPQLAGPSPTPGNLPPGGAPSPAPPPGDSAGPQRAAAGFWNWLAGTVAPPAQGTAHWMGPQRDESLRDAPAGKPPAGSGPPAEKPSPHPMWDGLNAAMGLSGDKIAQVPLERAATQARADYAKKILSSPPSAVVGADAAASSARRTGAVVSPAAPRGDAGRTPPDGAEKGMFVAVEMNLDHPGEYRDAVAGLSEAARFSIDRRFPPSFANDALRRVRVWGWMPGERLPAALKLPSVARLQIENAAAAPAAAAPGASWTETIVALRVPLSADPGEIEAATLERLRRQAGFVSLQTVGIQRIRNSPDRALIVSGRVPSRNLNRVLADPLVVKVLPLPVSAARSAEAAPAPPPSRLSRFLSFAFDRHPLVLSIACLLLAAQWLGRPRRTGRLR